MPVDSFKFLPRIIAAFYQTIEVQPYTDIPWTPLSKPVEACTFGLVTSAGLYDRVRGEPFDVEKEKGQPTWGDPTFRTIPTDVDLREIRISHLHINQEMVLEDINVLLPIDRMRELVRAEEIGGLAEFAYSFMGFQGYPPDASAWREVYGPNVADRLLSEGVQCVLLTPT
ncbi:MAG: glycine/sarcosine/betaine reductase selenoprotein B family protein [Anaerolineales bacterium]